MSVFAAIFGESVKGLAPNSYFTYPVTDEGWAAIKDAFAALGKDPNNAELGAKASALYKENVKVVMDKEEAFFALDPEKAAILQELVDKHSL